MPAVLVCGTHCYVELAVSSPAAADTAAGTYCTYPQRDGQAEWPRKYWNGRPAKWSPIRVLTGLDAA